MANTAGPLLPVILASARTNSSIDLLETYFEGAQIHKNEPPSAQETALFSDVHRGSNRTVSTIEWHPDAAKFGATYCSLKFQDEAQLGMSMESYIWDLSRPVRPIMTLTPPSPMCCLRFNPRQPDLVRAVCVYPFFL